MDTQALFWFQQVADGATVTQVGDVEHTAQSGVSRALARLESEVGTPLLRRSGRRLRLTHAGVAFKRHVDAMLHELDDGLAAVHQLVDPETGTVTLSFQPSLGTWLVPDLISRFRADHPGVRFDLRPKRDELTTALHARGDVDLELSTLRAPGPEVRWRGLLQQPLQLAVPATHPLAARTEVALSEVADEAFITIRPTSQLGPLFDELCARADVRPEVAFVCDDLPTMRGFVAAGLGVAVVPATPRTSSDPGAAQPRYLRLTDAGAAREVGLAWSTERRLLPAAALFREHVLDRAADGLLPSLGTA